MASKKVTNVGKNPITLADGTGVKVGEVVSVDEALLKGSPFYAAGWLKDGEHVAGTSEDAGDLRKQITALENQVADLEVEVEDLKEELDGAKKGSVDSAEALKVQTERAEKAEADLVEALKQKK